MFASQSHLARRLLVLFGAFVLVGCGEAGSGFVPVRGSIQLAGKPLKTGFISFRPDSAQGNNSLHVPTGSITADGRYELFTTGLPVVPPGWYRVLVFADKNQELGAAHPLPPQWMTDVKYTREETTDLLVQVGTDAAPDAYNLSLAK